MSISSDRQDLLEALSNLPQIKGQQVNLAKYTPAKAEPWLVYIERANTAPGTAFGSLEITWEITGTGSARQNVQNAASYLDQLTDALISAVHGAGAADLVSVEPYFSLIDNSSGGAIPATRLTFVSQTRIN